MTADPIPYTLVSVLESLKRRTRRERIVADLIGNVSWWLDVRCGRPLGSSTWALDDVDVALDETRLTEAPYLAATGYLVDLSVLTELERVSDAMAKVAKRAAHTIERAGYADDPLVLAGIWLLAKRVRVDVRSFRQEAMSALVASDVTPAVATLLCLVDPSLVGSCRPFGVADAITLAIAVAVGHTDGIQRLFPVVNLNEARGELMSSACMAGIEPGSKLEGAYASIGLAHAIEASTQSTLQTSPHVPALDREHTNQQPTRIYEPPPPSLATPPNPAGPPPAGGPVTHIHFHEPVSHLAMQSGSGTQTVTTNITQSSAEPQTNAQAWNQLRAETRAIREQLDNHHEIQLEAEDKRARIIVDLQHIIASLETRLPADGVFSRQAMKSATIDAIRELELERAIESHGLQRLAQSGVSQGLLASVIIEVIKFLA